jgi:hypothetical protein
MTTSESADRSPDAHDLTPVTVDGVDHYPAQQVQRLLADLNDRLHRLENAFRLGDGEPACPNQLVYFPVFTKDTGDLERVGSDRLAVRTQAGGVPASGCFASEQAVRDLVATLHNRTRGSS